MTVKKKIFLIILAIVLIISIAFSVLSTNSNFLNKLTGGVSADSGEPLSTVQVGEFNSDYPLVQTEQKDLFYSPNPNGKITYYKYSNNSFTEYKDVKTKDITVTCSYQKVNFTLYYTKTDAGTVGYGLYTSKQDENTKLFSYILVRMMDCPKALQSNAKTDYIIVTDMDAEDAYKNEKTYSDLYSFDLNSGKTVLMISQRDRLVQDDGTFREDWSVFTDISLNTMDIKDLFASARTTDTGAEEKSYNILTLANSRSYNKNSASTVNNSPSYNIWEKDGAYYCFVNTDEGFDIIKNGDKKNPVASFEGLFSDYTVSGHWIMNKSTADITDIYSGEIISANKTVYNTFGGFTANDNGTKFVYFVGTSSKSMIMYDAESNKSTVVTDENLYDSGILNFCFVDNDTIIVSAYGENGAVNRICKF